MSARFYDVGPCTKCGGMWFRLGPIDRVPDTQTWLAEFSCQTCGTVKLFSVAPHQRRALLDAE